VRAISSSRAPWNVSWCGRGPEGLQLMRTPEGRATDLGAQRSLRFE
jgi:hypothetical protein